MLRVDQAITDTHAKGGCYLCGNTNHLVDTEVYIDYEGVLAFCLSCVRDMAMTAGYDLEHDASAWDRLEAEAEEDRVLADSALKALSEIHETTAKARANHKSRLRLRAKRAERTEEAEDAD